MRLERNKEGGYSVLFKFQKEDVSELDDIIFPPELDDGDPKSHTRYLFTLYLWTRSCAQDHPDLYDSAKEKADQTKLGLYTKEGKYDAKQLAEISRFVFPRRETPPCYVLLEGVVSGKIKEEDLERFDTGKKTKEDEVFEKIAIHAAPASWDIHTSGDVRMAHYQKVLGWMRSVEPTHPDWNNTPHSATDFGQLGVIDAMGRFQEARFKKIAGFILAHIDDKPDYFRLWQWLKGEDRREHEIRTQAPESASTPQKKSAAPAAKAKRDARKRKKSARKRNRKRK